MRHYGLVTVVVLGVLVLVWLTWLAAKIKAEGRPSRSVRVAPLITAVLGAVVGWLSLQDFYGRPAYAATAEISVYVSAAAQGGGVGRRLVLHALERMPALALGALVGFVFAHNAPSVALFEGLRFARWGHLPRVARLDGVERDLLILGRRLD